MRSEQAFAKVDVAAGEGEGVHQIAVGQEMKGIRQTAMRALPERETYALNVAFVGAFFSGELRGDRVALSEFVADGDFFVVGETGEPHGGAGEIALRVGNHVHDGVSGNRDGPLMALSVVERREGYEQHSDERGGTFHKYWRIFSL
jgi:hypothetical protein